MSDAQDEAAPKLPLWDTICLSYSIFFRDFRDVLSICWLWIIVLAPVMTIQSALQWSWIGSAVAQLKAGGVPRQSVALSLRMPLELRLFTYGVGLLVAVAGVSIAVAWHRRIILGEQPRLSGSNVATGSLWRYVAVGIAILLISFVPIVLGVLVVLLFLFSLIPLGVSGGHNVGLVVIVVVMVLCYLIFITVMLRLCLLLPARAVGDISVTFERAWKSTRGNTWRIFWGILACTLPVVLVQIPFLAFWHLFGSPNPANFASGSFSVPGLALSAVFSIYYLLTLPIWIGFLSLSYLHFFERRRGLPSSTPQ